MRPRPEYTKVFSHGLTLQPVCMAYATSHRNELGTVPGFPEMAFTQERRQSNLLLGTAQGETDTFSKCLSLFCS